MNRLFFSVVIYCTLTGCQSHNPPAADPFFGRTRVPPPSTGSIAGGSNAPPFQPAPQSAPQVTVPGAAAPQPVPGGNPRYAPPGGTYQYKGGSADRPGTPNLPRPATRVPPPPISGRTPENRNTMASRQPVVRTIHPRALADSSAAGRPRGLNHPDRVIDIMDLPRPVSSKAPSTRDKSSTSNGFRLVSGTEPPGRTAPVTATAAVAKESTAENFAPRSGYGHAPDYKWLQGKLEYSQIDRHWKLRYIPVNGETDEFGGSVILPDPSLLGGCERGDLIKVTGRVGRRDPNKGYAPAYEVANIERLGKVGP